MFHRKRRAAQKPHLAEPTIQAVSADGRRGAFRDGGGDRAEPGARAPAVVEAAAHGRMLTVGPEIMLQGAITSCESLLVEGHVEATTFTGRFVEIAASGTFKGSAEVDAAKIAGQFDGELVVRDGLCLTATGRISGKVSYARLEVAPGGQLCGDVTIAEPVARSNAA